MGRLGEKSKKVLEGPFAPFPLKAPHASISLSMASEINEKEEAGGLGKETGE